MCAALVGPSEQRAFEALPQQVGPANLNMLDAVVVLPSSSIHEVFLISSHVAADHDFFGSWPPMNPLKAAHAVP